MLKFNGLPKAILYMIELIANTLYKFVIEMKRVRTEFSEKKNG